MATHEISLKNILVTQQLGQTSTLFPDKILFAILFPGLEN